MTFDTTLVLETVPRLLQAGGSTLAIAFASLAVGLAGASILTLLRAAKRRPLSLLVAGLRSLICGTPLLLTVFVAYYVLPAAGLDLSPSAAGILAIGVTSAFFLSEIVRGCLSTLPGGQIEAAVALGLRAPTIWARIVLPQVLRAMVPHLVNEFTVVVKATALLSAITVTDLLRTAQQIYAVNYRPLETLTAAAIIYAAISLSVSRFGHHLEGRLERRRR